MISYSHKIYYIQMHKNFKVIEEQQYTLQAGQSPKTKPEKKMKIRNLINQQQTLEFQFINEKVREKLSKSNNLNINMAPHSNMSMGNKQISNLNLQKINSKSKQLFSDEGCNPMNSQDSYHRKYIDAVNGQYHNPYAEIYENDMKYWEEYQQSTLKYQNSGINLKWPYYFTKNGKY